MHKNGKNLMCKQMESFVARLCGLAAEAKDLGLKSDDHFDAILSDTYRSMGPTETANENNKTGSVVDLHQARAQLRWIISSLERF